jgi:hypothetical protein
MLVGLAGLTVVAVAIAGHWTGVWWLGRGEVEQGQTELAEAVGGLSEAMREGADALEALVDEREWRAMAAQAEAVYWGQP